MANLLVRCATCGTELQVAAGRLGEGLRGSGWALLAGKIYCPSCAPAPAAPTVAAGAASIPAPASASPAIALAPATAERPNPDAALRARINAGIYDNILVNLLCAGLILALSVPFGSLDALGLYLVTQFGYYFCFESAGGSPGKRRYGLQVVKLDGGRLDAGAVAVRNALRVIDSFPLYYASGLVTLMLSGRARRQRIGDRLAGTQVISRDPARQRLRTPGWLLPALTGLSLLMAGGLVLALKKASNAPVTPAFEARFVAACAAAGTGADRCACMFVRLRDDYGVDTPAKFSALADEARAAVAARDVRLMPASLRGAALSCRGAPTAPAPGQ